MLVKKLIITGLSDSFPRNATAKVSIIFLPTTILRPHFFEKHKNETSGSDPIVSFFSVLASSGPMSIKQIHAREAVLFPKKNSRPQPCNRRKGNRDLYCFGYKMM